MNRIPIWHGESKQDADGDTIVVDRLSDTERIISRLLKCSRKDRKSVV